MLYKAQQCQRQRHGHRHRLVTSLTSLTLFFIEAPANLGEVTRVDAHCKVGPHKGCRKQNLDLGRGLVTLMSIELKLYFDYDVQINRIYSRSSVGEDDLDAMQKKLIFRIRCLHTEAYLPLSPVCAIIYIQSLLCQNDLAKSVYQSVSTILH